MKALAKIKQAGFDIALDGRGFKITPASALTQSQREFLKQHKAEIIKELSEAASQPKLQVFNYRITDKHNSELTVCTTDNLAEVEEGLINRYGLRLVSVTCYTPAGKPIQVEAKDEEHAAWLLQMNPQPKGIQPC